MIFPVHIDIVIFIHEEKMLQNKYLRIHNGSNTNMLLWFPVHTVIKHCEYSCTTCFMWSSDEQILSIILWDIPWMEAIRALKAFACLMWRIKRMGAWSQTSACLMHGRPTYTRAHCDHKTHSFLLDPSVHWKPVTQSDSLEAIVLYCKSIVLYVPMHK